MSTVLVFTIALSLANCVQLPKIFQKCDYKKADVDQCLIKGIEAGVAYLKDQPLRSVGLPKIEPVEITEFSVAEGTGPVGVRQNFRNVKLYGLSKAQVKSAAIHLEKENGYVNVSAILPEIIAKADYDLNGKVLVMPVHGKGHATIIFTNLKVEVYFPLRRVQKNGQEYIEITSSGKLWFPSEDHVSYNFENLFDGNKEMGDNLNKVLNDNWKEIFDDVKSGYEELFYKVLKSMASPVFSKVQISELIDNVP